MPKRFWITLSGFVLLAVMSTIHWARITFDSSIAGFFGIISVIMLVLMLASFALLTISLIKRKSESCVKSAYWGFALGVLNYIQLIVATRFINDRILEESDGVMSLSRDFTLLPYLMLAVAVIAFFTLRLLSNKNIYPYDFLVPIGIIYVVVFLIPTAMSFFFSMTRWTLTEWTFIGLENFVTFFTQRRMFGSLINTIIYAVSTSGLKVVFGLLIGAFLCSGLRTVAFLRSMLFFPTLLSTMAVGITFASFMHPTTGLINQFIALFGVEGPSWLGNVDIALWSVIFVDVWKGVGLATVIYIAGIMSIDSQLYEALQIDGGNKWHKFRYITVPLCKPAMNTVIILSFIGGLRSFDLIWVMTGGGPGFATDVLTSMIFKQWANGFFGLSVAGNVVLFLLVTIMIFPLFWWLNRREAEAS